MDLYNYQFLPNLPYAQPTDQQAAPGHAPTFQTYVCTSMQLGNTSLDTYVAPGPNKSTQYYNANASTVGNGLVFYGNTPTSGIYTGVQME